MSKAQQKLAEMHKRNNYTKSESVVENYDCHLSCLGIDSTGMTEAQKKQAYIDSADVE